MTKKADKTTAAPFTEDNGGALPGELPAFGEQGTIERSTDASMFVAFDEPGDTFDGVFIRKVMEGTNGELELKHKALLYVSYPDGELRLLPYGWSQGEEIAKQTDKDRNLQQCVQRSTLKSVKVTDEGTKKEKVVKLFDYGYMTLTAEQAASFLAKAHGDDRLIALMK